jgi:hypothetical protein
MSEAVLSPGRRFFLALVMIFSPMAAPVFTNSYAFSTQSSVIFLSSARLSLDRWFWRSRQHSL